MVWFAAVFILVAALFAFLQRRRLAEMQALIIGGSVAPGCVIAEAAALVILAAVIVVFGRAL